MPVIRGTGLTGFPALVTDLGGDPAALLARAGISQSDVGRFDAFIAYPALIHAVETAAAATQTPDFGRWLAERQGIEVLGPVGVAARTSKTVAEALEIFDQYLGAYSPAIAASISPGAGNTADTSSLEFKILISRPPVHPQTIELSLGVALRVLRFLLGTG